MSTRRLPSTLKPEWNKTTAQLPQVNPPRLLMAMYDNGLTAQPAIITASLVRSMPSKYPCWRELIPGQDYVVYEEIAS